MLTVSQKLGRVQLLRIIKSQQRWNGDGVD